MTLLEKGSIQKGNKNQQHIYIAFIFGNKTGFDKSE
jgi:hypothetical protein